MKLPRASLNCNGFTLVEVLVMLFVILIVVAMVSPFEPHAHKKPPIYECMNNQRQLTIGFILWQTDNTNQFPWQVSIANGGTMEDAAHGNAGVNFRALDAYIKAPQVFICPTDKVKVAPTNVATIHNVNVSYFVGLDFNTNAAACILTGDRDLQVRRSPVLPGLLVHANGLTMGWTGELHGGLSPAKGVMSFYDGHVEVVAGPRMDEVFNHAGLVMGRFDVP